MTIDTADVRALVRLFIESDNYSHDSINYMNCPVCGGARKMMVVPYEKGGHFVRCFRGKCGAQWVQGGRVPTWGDGRPAARAPERKYITYKELGELVPFEPALVADRNFAPDVLRILMAQQQQLVQKRTVFWVRDLSGRVRGASLRTWRQGEAPKTIMRPMHPSDPLVGWGPYAVSGAHVVIVEDPLSALRLDSTCIYGTLCLFGTGLPGNLRQELVRLSPLRVTVALDGDVPGQALSLVRQLRGIFPGVSIHARLCPQDLKDMDEDTFREWVVATESS